MKILLDESVPQKLRLLIEEGHIVITAWFQGWSGLKNGALLDAAEEAGFDLFITADQELRYQQNHLPETRNPGPQYEQLDTHPDACRQDPSSSQRRRSWQLC
jgi:hypothetical protein